MDQWTSEVREPMECKTLELIRRKSTGEKQHEYTPSKLRLSQHTRHIVLVNAISHRKASAQTEASTCLDRPCELLCVLSEPCFDVSASHCVVSITLCRVLVRGWK